MLRQFDLIQDITQVAFQATDDDFDELVLEVELKDADTIAATCRQTVNGATEQLSLENIHDPDLRALSYQLKEEMKNHTGGNLARYTIRINEEGKANANFEYDNEPQG